MNFCSAPDMARRGDRGRTNNTSSTQQEFGAETRGLHLGFPWDYGWTKTMLFLPRLPRPRRALPGPMWQCWARERQPQQSLPFLGAALPWLSPVPMEDSLPQTPWTPVRPDSLRLSTAVGPGRAFHMQELVDSAHTHTHTRTHQTKSPGKPTFSAQGGPRGLTARS